MNGLQLVSYSVNSDFELPFDRCLLEFEGRELAIYAGSLTECDTVETIIENEQEFDQAYEIVSKFLHTIAWGAHSGFEITSVSSMGLQERIKLPRKRPFSLSPRVFPHHVHIWSLRVPQTEEAHIALSLYSEAEHSRSPFQAFLCYWKILEIRFPGRTEHGAGQWINKAIQQGLNIYLTDEVNEMVANGVDVGVYFTKECRNAVAHIQITPPLVSYNWDDRLKIMKAVRALHGFVDYFIENEIGLPCYAQPVNVKHIVNPSGNPLYSALPDRVQVSIDAPPDVGRRVRALRQALGMSQARLAQFAQTSRHMVSQIERGGKPRDLTILPRVAKELGVRLAQLSSPPDWQTLE